MSWVSSHPVLRTFLLVSTILCIVFLAFLPTLQNSFVNWDDDVHLIENPAVRGLNPNYLAQIFSQTINHLYIPLTTLSFAVEYFFRQYDPFIYHLDNLLLHLLNTWLVFVIVGQLGLKTLAAVLTALIFGLHPIHVESVAWVTERKDVLCAVFYLGAIHLYLRYIRENKKIFYLLSWFSGLFSMLAKPMALSLPLVLLLCDWVFQRRDKRCLLEKIYYVLYIVPIAWMSYIWHARLPMNNFVESILVWVWCFAFYIKKFFWPYPLFLFYKLPEPMSLTQMAYLWSLGILAVFSALLFLFWKNRFVIFALAYYFVTIFFLLRFDTQDANVVGDRFLYLPSFGFCLLMAMFWEKIFMRCRNNSFFSFLAILSLILFLGALAWKTSSQCRVWYSGTTLWSYQLKVNPTTATALLYHKLGYAKTEEKEFKEAVSRLRAYAEGRAVSFSESDVKKINEVLQWQQRALAVKPDFGNAYFYMGDLYHQLGEPTTAEELYQKTIQVDATHFLAYFRLGQLYQEEGKAVEAVRAYRQAIMVNPTNPYLLADIKAAYEKYSHEEKQGRVYQEELKKINQVTKGLSAFAENHGF